MWAKCRHTVKSGFECGVCHEWLPMSKAYPEDADGDKICRECMRKFIRHRARVIHSLPYYLRPDMDLRQRKVITNHGGR